MVIKWHHVVTIYRPARWYHRTRVYAYVYAYVHACIYIPFLFNHTQMSSYMTTAGIHSTGGSAGDVSAQIKSLTLRLNTIQIDLSNLMAQVGTAASAAGQVATLQTALLNLEKRVQDLEAKVP